MISPNRENIDRWLFDYTEGNLSAEQEAMLENFILNNPDIEVDLDAWESAKLVSEEVNLPNKAKYKKRRVLLPYYLVGMIILLISGSVWFSNSNKFNKVQISSNYINKSNIAKEKKTSESMINSFSASTNNHKSNFSNEQVKTSFNESSSSLLNPNNFGIPTETKFHLNNGFDPTTQIQNQSNSILGYEENTTVENSNLNDRKKVKFNDLATEEVSEFQKYSLMMLGLNKIDSKSINLEHYQIRNEELHLGSTQDDHEGMSLDLGKLKLVQKIEKVLEKDLGLSNIPDHSYAIPEYSNVDVLFSNIGATSQIRFQSTSMARWIEDLEQHKFSQQVTLDGYSRGSQSGFGIQANYDYFGNGSIQNWNTCLMFSPKIALSRTVSVEPAMRFKIGNKLLNEDRIENHTAINYESHTQNQFNFDTSLAIGSKLWYRDIDFGLTVNTPYFYLGGQVSNVLRHQNNIYSNFENLDMRAKNVYNAIIGTQYISRNQKIQFSPYCFFERTNSNRLFAGFNFKLNKVMIGGSFGTGKIGTGVFGLAFKNFAIYAQSSYGYVQAIARNSSTHQLTIRINSNIDKKSRRYITF